MDDADFQHALRIAEALIFASDRPVPAARVQLALPAGVEAQAVLTALAARTAGAAVELVEVPRRLPRAAMEALAIIAYHQPVTRAEIEEIRGAALAQSTLDSLLDAGLVGPRGRRESPGRPTLWGTTPRFLDQFGLKSLAELPRREELVSQDLAVLELAPPAPG